MIPEKPKGLQATPDQWKAIATRGNNLLVSASSLVQGKQSSCRTYFDAYSRGIDINELLVVTLRNLSKGK